LKVLADIVDLVSDLDPEYYHPGHWLRLLRRNTVIAMKYSRSAP
jgi:hypothetical protein